jgi:sortase A
MKLKQKIISFLTISLGICMILYPWISNYIYTNSVNSEITSYKSDVKDVKENDYDQMLKDAKLYNEELAQSNVQLTDPFIEDVKTNNNVVEYSELLSLNDQGLMGYVNIPCIGTQLRPNWTYWT